MAESSRGKLVIVFFFSDCIKVHAHPAVQVWMHASVSEVSFHTNACVCVVSGV